MKTILFAVMCAAVLSLGAETASAQSAQAGQIIVNAGAPVNGTDEIQTITIGGTPTAGSFKLTFNGRQTGAINWSATNATLVANIDAALEALHNIGTGGVATAVGTATAGIGTFTVTFSGTRLSKRDVVQMTVASSLTGTSPTIGVTTTTAGVNATALGADKGVLLIDSSTPDLYINDGTTTAPTWTKVSP